MHPLHVFSDKIAAANMNNQFPGETLFSINGRYSGIPQFNNCGLSALIACRPPQSGQKHTLVLNCTPLTLVTLYWVMGASISLRAEVSVVYIYIYIYT